MVGSHERVIAFDPLNQYLDKSDQFTFVCSQPTELHKYVTDHFNENWRILYTPKDATVMKHWRAVGVIAYARGDLTLLIDEIGLLCQFGQFKRDAKNDDPILEKIIHFGRHRNINVVATSQLPTDIALRYRSLCAEFRIFQIDEKSHLDYLAERIGAKTASELPNLQKYDYVWWQDTGDVYVVHGEVKQ